MISTQRSSLCHPTTTCLASRTHLLIAASGQLAFVASLWVDLSLTGACCLTTEAIPTFIFAALMILAIAELLWTSHPVRSTSEVWPVAQLCISALKERLAAPTLQWELCVPVYTLKVTYAFNQVFYPASISIHQLWRDCLPVLTLSASFAVSNRWMPSIYHPFAKRTLLTQLDYQVWTVPAVVVRWQWPVLL